MPVACATKRHCCAWNITLPDNNAPTQAVAPAQTWLNKLSQRPWWADLLLLSAVWGSSFMFTKIAAQDIGAMPTAFGRVAVAALFLVPLLLWKRETASLAQHWKKAFLIGIFNSGIPFAAYAYALLTISTSTGAIANASTALFGAVIAWLWLKDKPSLSRTIGLVLGFTGVCLLALQNARSAPTGDLASQLLGMLWLVCQLHQAALFGRTRTGIGHGQPTGCCTVFGTLRVVVVARPRHAVGHHWLTAGCRRGVHRHGLYIVFPHY